MALFDLAEPELFTYRPEVAQPADFDQFWEQTLAQARAFDLFVTVTPVDSGLDLVDTFDVEFAGFDGHRVKAWLIMPAGAAPGSLPAVVSYVGYGGGRGHVQEHLVWANAGFAQLHMDTRGQGSAWGSGGDTPDPAGSGPATPGFMTRGIEDPHAYYYRRVFTDAVRAVEAVRTLPQVDPTRVSITGVSQGGGITLAVAGLIPDLLAVLPDVPFLCNFRRATAIADTTPYAEITKYLSIHRNMEARAFTTLSYFDAVNFAKRATAPALFSVALMDPICPPSTVFSAYNVYGELWAQQSGSAGPGTEIEIYRFNQHEGGQFYQLATQVQWLRERAGLSKKEIA